MLSFKAIAVVVVTLPLLAVANPLAARTGSSQCNSGTLNCCQETSNVEGGSGVLGGLLNGLMIGSGCTPIIPVVGGSHDCNQQTVCCNSNTFNGLIVLACTPVNLNL